MKILILYSSIDGQTKNISQKIQEILSFKNDVELLPIESSLSLDLSSFSKIIIGASIRYGKHKPEVYNFIKINKQILNKTKNAFFSVNVVARKQEKNSPETNPYIKKFLKISNWKPDIIDVFAGKIDYPSYGFFDKYIIRLIMFVTKGPTNITKSYEFTDWGKVENFAKKVDLVS